MTLSLPRGWSAVPGQLVAICERCQQSITFRALESGHTLNHFPDGRWGTGMKAEEGLCESSPNFVSTYAHAARATFAGGLGQAQRESMTDHQLREECARRGVIPGGWLVPGARSALEASTDDQLRAELTRRLIDGVVSLAEVVKAATDKEIVVEMNRRGLGLAEMGTETLLQALKNRGWNGVAVDGAIPPEHLDLVEEVVSYLRDPGAPMVLVEAETVAQSARLLSTGAYGAERLKARLDELLALEAKLCPCGCNALCEGRSHVAGSAAVLVNEAQNTRPCTCGAMNCRRDHEPIRMDPPPAFTYLEALKGLKPDFEVPDYDAPTRRTEFSGDAQALIESGPGIARLPEPRSEPLAFLDEDLLCDDE